MELENSKKQANNTQNHEHMYYHLLSLEKGLDQVIHFRCLCFELDKSKENKEMFAVEIKCSELEFRRN